MPWGAEGVGKGRARPRVFVTAFLGREAGWVLSGRWARCKALRGQACRQTGGYGRGTALETATSSAPACGPAERRRGPLCWLRTARASAGDGWPRVVRGQHRFAWAAFARSLASAMPFGRAICSCSAAAPVPPAATRAAMGSSGSGAKRHLNPDVLFQRGIAAHLRLTSPPFDTVVRSRRAVVTLFPTALLAPRIMLTVAYAQQLSTILSLSLLLAH